MQIPNGLSKKGIHLQRLARDATICHAWVLYFKFTLRQGKPPSFPQYTTWRSCPLPWSSMSWQWRVPLDSYIKRMKQAFNKKVCLREFQKDLVLKKTLPFNQSSGAKRCLITKYGDKKYWLTPPGCNIIFSSSIFIFSSILFFISHAFLFV